MGARKRTPTWLFHGCLFLSVRGLCGDDAPSAARTRTTGRLDAPFVLGAANAFAVCARATRAVKPTGAATRARNVTACIVAPSTVREVKVQIELGGTFLGCHLGFLLGFFLTVVSHSSRLLSFATTVGSRVQLDESILTRCPHLVLFLAMAFLS